MSRRKHGVLCVAVLLLFLLATFFVHFFHTEKGLRPSASCPACHFQSTSLAVGLGLAIVLPQFPLVEMLIVLESDAEMPVLSFELVSRPPPLA
jgi:hypothetical protein